MCVRAHPHRSNSLYTHTTPTTCISYVDIHLQLAREGAAKHGTKEVGLLRCLVQLPDRQGLNRFRVAVEHLMGTGVCVCVSVCVWVFVCVRACACVYVYAYACSVLDYSWLTERLFSLI